MHGWIKNGQIDGVLAASFRVLKHGGVLGIEQHRARPDASINPKVIGDTGYVPEAFAIQLAEKAGFKLEAKSEVNANPSDTKDYARACGPCPPRFAWATRIARSTSPSARATG